MLEPPQLFEGSERPSSSDRAAYRWLLELLLDAFVRQDVRDQARAVVCASDGTVSVWKQVFRDHCPRCKFIRRVYLCDSTRALACLCRLCRTLQVFDVLGRTIAFAVSRDVVSDDLPPELSASRHSVDELLAARAKPRLLPFVALWPLRSDRPTRTAMPRPASKRRSRASDSD
jgi:hypothetical protein